MEIHITKNGSVTGPFTLEQISGMISSGMISHEDLAWTPGAQDWQSLSSVLGLSSESSPALPEEESDSLEQTGPKGVGGWLKFFCFGLIFLSPWRNLSQISQYLAQPESDFAFPALKTALTLDCCGKGALLVYALIVGCVIWQGNPKGRAIAKRFLLVWFSATVALSLLELVIVSGLPGKIVDAFLGGAFLTILHAGFFSLIWWLYFTKSKRVRNTYGPE